MMEYGIFLGLNIRFNKEDEEVLKTGIKKIIEDVICEKASENAQIVVAEIPTLCHSILEVSLDRQPQPAWLEQISQQIVGLIQQVRVLSPDITQRVVAMSCKFYKSIKFFGSNDPLPVDDKRYCKKYPDECDRCAMGGAAKKDRLAPCKF